MIWEVLKWRPTHSSWSISPSKWRDISHPPTISFFIPFSPFHFMFLSLSSLISCSWVSLIIMSMVHHLGGYVHHWCLPCAHLNYAIASHPHYIFDLCLYRSEPSNLTTWLSSCPVGIFLGFSVLIVKISILSKSVTVNESIQNQLTSIYLLSFSSYLFSIAKKNRPMCVCCVPSADLLHCQQHHLSSSSTVIFLQVLSLPL